MYLGFQGLRAVVQRLPLDAGRALGAALGAAAYTVLRGQRRVTLEHLEAALGDRLSARERRRVARGVFMNLGRTAMEWLTLPALSIAQIQSLIDVEGLEHLKAAMAKGDGAIVVGPHFGNWELIAIYLRSLGFEGGVLARRLRYPEYEAFLVSMRGQRGVPTFARGSIKDVARLLRANQIIGLMPDQDIDSLEGVFIDVFGRSAYTPVGPAALSQMTGAPIVPCAMIRCGRRFQLRIRPAVSAPPRASTPGAPAGGDRREAMRQLTQAWSDALCGFIREHPEQWVWMHRRWKTRPEADPARSAAAAPARPTEAVALILATWLLASTAAAGCRGPHTETPEAPAESAASEPQPPAEQEMSSFSLTGYGAEGGKTWQLDGDGARVAEGLVTVQRPRGVGYDTARQADLTAAVALVDQRTRHVRLEHDVTIHTSDGLWFSTPVLHWMPDADRMATDQPVRIETDHMLLRGRGIDGHTQLKLVTIAEDIELVLNPVDGERAARGVDARRADGADGHVTITCDGPLAFDYERNVATFETNVHVQDPSGELFSDRLVAYFDGDSRTIRYAEAVGNVRIQQGPHTAFGDRAVYEPAQGKITLLGRPSLTVIPDEPGSPIVAIPAGRR